MKRVPLGFLTELEIDESGGVASFMFGEYPCNSVSMEDIVEAAVYLVNNGYINKPEFNDVSK